MSSRSISWRPSVQIAFAVLPGLAAIAEAAAVRAQETAPTHDEQAVLAVVDSFHAALSHRDSAAAVGFLAEDAVVLEHGLVESRSEYTSHHLREDMAFAADVERVRKSVQIKVTGESAWVSSIAEVTSRGTARRTAQQVAETMILSRFGDEWKIAAIHWSSRPLLRRTMQ